VNEANLGAQHVQVGRADQAKPSSAAFAGKNSIVCHRLGSLCASGARLSKHKSAISPRVSREFCHQRFALPKGARPTPRGGAGKTGCALHPRSRVQKQIKDAHEHTGSAEAVRPSLRNGFTAYSALSLATGFLVTIIRVMRSIIANLTPASGRQDHTTSPSASRAVRQERLHVHRIPLHVRDDRETPLVWSGTARISR
jgi:hypothetical protein